MSTYTDLPAARYDEVVQFIKEQYRILTGDEGAGDTRPYHAASSIE